MTARLALVVLVSALSISSAALGDPAATPSPPNGTKPESAANGMAAGGKRRACTQEVSTKRLRGPDRVDALQICMAEGRLACTKQAVAQKIPTADRRNFLNKCMTGA